MSERGSDWCFTVQRIVIQRGVRQAGTSHQHAALRSVLRQLRALDAPGAVVTFSGWQWSQALADVLTEALPSLSHLNITVPEVTHNAGEYKRVWLTPCVQYSAR